MVSKTRLKQISDRIKEELTIIVLWEASDPRLEGVSITHIRVDPEISFADVYISAVDGEERSRDILSGLRHAQGYLRSELARRISHLPHLPELRFHWDDTFEKASRIDQLIAEIEAEEISKAASENDG